VPQDACSSNVKASLVVEEDWRQPEGQPVLRRTLEICRSSSSANGALLVASKLSAMGRSSCAAALAAVTCAGKV